MTNSIVEDNQKLKMIQSKIHNLTVEELKGLTSDEFKALLRVSYLETFVKPLPSFCPECHSELMITEDEDEMECSCCGLIVMSSIRYVAGQRIDLPYGRR